MPDFEQIWTEKYRPSKLEDIVGQEDIVKRLRAFVRGRSIPNLLFAGPPGVGKTTAAVCMARELFGQDWRTNFMETNASDERRIDDIRYKIKEFAKTMPVGRSSGAEFRIIFLDECDALTKDAQNALRRTMESHTNTCRFILSCNYSSKIIEPIQSRCLIFRFGTLKEEDIAKYVGRIAEAEGLKMDAKVAKAIIEKSEGDMRRVVNMLQAASAIHSHITESDVYKVAQEAEPKKVKEILELAVSGRFKEARERMQALVVGEGLSGEDIIKEIHRNIFDLNVEEEKKMRIVEKVGEYDFRILEGADERIQLDALLAQIAFIGRG